MTADPRISVGLESGRGGVLAHAFDLPGCVAHGADAEEAVEGLPAMLSAWLRFLAAHGEPVPDARAEIEIAVDEWIDTGADVEAGESVACFDHDRIALDREEILRGLGRLGDLRARLLRSVRRAPAEELEVEGDAVPITRVLDELARAQWWTLARLGFSPMAEVPERVLARLDTSQALTIQHFTELPEERLGLALEIDGEEWTPRKVMRRMLWNEWSLGEIVVRRRAEAGVP